MIAALLGGFSFQEQDIVPALAAIPAAINRKQQGLLGSFPVARASATATMGSMRPDFLERVPGPRNRLLEVTSAAAPRSSPADGMAPTAPRPGSRRKTLSLDL